MRRDTSSALLNRLPPFLLILAVFSLSMYVPALYALVRDNHPPARSFFYTGTMGLFIVALIALALGNRPTRYSSLGQLNSLLATYVALPAFLAIPFFDTLPTTAYLNAYFDMVSAITTTGMNLFDDPDRLPNVLHLWRAQVAWMGGLLMWIAASAVLAPLSLGGFEVTAQGEPGLSVPSSGQMVRADPRKRLYRAAAGLAPVYVGLTFVVWTLLMMSGERTLTGLSHAMSVMATSGLSPVGGVPEAASGFAGEAILFLFMFFALSRLTFSSDTVTRGYARLDKDPEFRIGLLLVLGVPILLFARHWLAVLDVSDTAALTEQAVKAFWGATFTVMSFLTTTGFVSADWQAAQSWSGLNTPGLILMGLALMGGGVATTAGGVKLLRVFALYLNGLREVERLVHPSSVSGSVGANQRIQRGGAFVAWIFFMLFAMSLALITVALAILGVEFEQAIILSIASLSTTGPLTEVAGEMPIRLAELGALPKYVLCAAMVLGRLETLAIIALLAPSLWRN